MKDLLLALGCLAGIVALIWIVSLIAPEGHFLEEAHLGVKVVVIIGLTFIVRGILELVIITCRVIKKRWLS